MLKCEKRSKGRDNLPFSPVGERFPLGTQEQTNIGLFWAYDGTKNICTPPRFYNQIARVIAQQRGNTVVENARLFALTNIAMTDAGIASWESKYAYNFWRPVMAIREADADTGPTGLGDGNPLTAGNPAWTPMGAPASNQSGKGNARPLLPRSFARLSDATRENAQSRIYLGIHWQFDATEGIKMGNSIADYVYANALKRVTR